MTLIDTNPLQDHRTAFKAPQSVWRLVSKQANLIVTLREAEGPPFYCIHPVAGDISSYNKLFALLAPWQGVYGIQVTKKNMRAENVGSVVDMAREYAGAIASHRPNGPLMVGGYSAGAIIGLEVAQQLRRAGRDVQLLVALDGAPLNSGSALRPWHPLYVSKLVGNVPRWFCSRPLGDWSLSGLYRRIIEKFVFRASDRGAGVTPEQHLDVVARLAGRAGWAKDQVSFIQSLYSALHAYIPQSYDGRVLVFEARIQPIFQVLQTARIWSSLASRCECVTVASDHTTLLDGGAATAVVASHLNAIFRQLRDVSA